MTKKELISRVMQLPGVDSPDKAEQLVTLVFQALRDRLTADEADDVWAQLPTAWKQMWESGDWWERLTSRMRGMNKLNREEFLNWLQEHMPQEVDPEQVARIVFHALKEQISPGEAADVSAQLPEDLRTFWRAA